MKFLGLLLLVFAVVQGAKIKDVSNIIGIRDNKLIGYGLVVGLNKTGDGTTSIFTRQTLSNMLQTMNVKMDPADVKTKNVAAVVVTATLPPFARQGDTIDVQVSSIGDAKSLEGGTLLMTPLKGIDGNIYAIAQGPMSIGGRNGRGAGTLNHANAGTIPGGALVEQEVVYDLYHQRQATLSLKEPSLQNAVAVQKSLNVFYKHKVAVAIDPKTVSLNCPEQSSMVEFLAGIGEVEIVYTNANRIVIDERTGTVVAGVDIEVAPVLITHGEITIKILPIERLVANEATELLDENVQIDRERQVVNTVKGGSTVANIARSLKKLGAAPKDIISVIEAMKQAGAIQADLQII